MRSEGNRLRSVPSVSLNVEEAGYAVMAARSSTMAVAMSRATDQKARLSQRSRSRQAPPATRMTCHAASGDVVAAAIARRGGRPRETHSGSAERHGRERERGGERDPTGQATVDEHAAAPRPARGRRVRLVGREVEVV